MPMHVRDQIVAAIVTGLTEAIPDAQGRVYAHSDAEWDGRKLPMLVVTPTKTNVDKEPGTGDRVQRRETEIVVQIRDVEIEGDPYQSRISSLSIVVERVLSDLPDAVPVDDAEMIHDTGIVDIKEDGIGIHAGTALVFGIAYFTRSGDATRLVLP